MHAKRSISATTAFAPAFRYPSSEIRKHSLEFQDADFFRSIVDAAPNIFLVVNDARQIVFANRAFADFVDAKTEDELLGKRPGEAVNCIHSDLNPSGCGTSRYCSACGAVRAVLKSLQGKETTEECRILLKDGMALDLQVWAKPLSVGGKSFSFIGITDISHQRRRHTLERLFFHDILNAAGGIRGAMELLGDSQENDIEELKEIAVQLSVELIDLIQSQRQLLAAEQNDLKVDLAEVSPRDVVQKLQQIYSQHPVAKGKNVATQPAASLPETLVTDETLLLRVLGNMLKNSLEAAEEHGLVTIGAEAMKKKAGVLFWVHGSNFIDEKVQLQIFQRSFSTKGSDRGLGTYSMKLFGEKFLKGKVYFESTKQKGTKFVFECPSVENEKN